jgi:hypothetical protein
VNAGETGPAPRSGSTTGPLAPTGEFIGEREVVTSHDLEIPFGTVSGHSSVSRAVVDRIGEVPGG